MTTEQTASGNLLDLTKPEDLAAYQTLLLFLRYIDDVGVGAYLVRAIARDLYSGAIVDPTGTDASEIYEEARRDIRGTSTNITFTGLFSMLVGIGAAFAGREVPGTTEPEPEPTAAYDLSAIAGSAPSLALLREYAAKVSEFVFPENAIPSEAFVRRCLGIFHATHAAAVDAEIAEATGSVEESVASNDGSRIMVRTVARDD